MADLPKDPNLTDNSQDDLNDVKYYSPSPEQMGAPIPVESITPVEKAPEAEVEAPRPTPKPVVEPTLEKPQEAPVVPVAPVKPEQKIVDERPQTTSTAHHLTTNQPLTARADKEEEDFIEHVEQIHEHQ